MKYYYYVLFSTLCVVFSSLCQAKTVHASVIRLFDYTSYHHCQYSTASQTATLVNQTKKDNLDSWGSMAGWAETLVSQPKKENVDLQAHYIYIDATHVAKIARVTCTSDDNNAISFVMHRSLNKSNFWQRLTGYPGFDFNIKMNNDASHPMHVCFVLGQVERGCATINLRDTTPCIDGDIEIQ